MAFKYLLIVRLSLSFVMGCASVAQKKPDFYEIKVEEFSSSVKLLLTDINFFEDMNEVWDNWLPENCAPARATVEAKLALPELLVEICVIATN